MTLSCFNSKKNKYNQVSDKNHSCEKIQESILDIKKNTFEFGNPKRNQKQAAIAAAASQLSHDSITNDVLLFKKIGDYLSTGVCFFDAQLNPFYGNNELLRIMSLLNIKDVLAAIKSTMLEEKEENNYDDDVKKLW